VVAELLQKLLYVKTRMRGGIIPQMCYSFLERFPMRQKPIDHLERGIFAEKQVCRIFRRGGVLDGFDHTLNPGVEDRDILQALGVVFPKLLPDLLVHFG